MNNEEIENNIKSNTMNIGRLRGDVKRWMSEIKKEIAGIKQSATKQEQNLDYERLRAVIERLMKWTNFVPEENYKRGFEREKSVQIALRKHQAIPKQRLCIRSNVGRYYLVDWRYIEDNGDIEEIQDIIIEGVELNQYLRLDVRGRDIDRHTEDGYIKAFRGEESQGILTDLIYDSGNGYDEMLQKLLDKEYSEPYTLEELRIGFPEIHRLDVIVKDLEKPITEIIHSHIQANLPPIEHEGDNE